MHWIESKKFDLMWIIGPAFFSVLFVLIFHFFGIAPKTTSPIYWLIFVVFIDVGHVWSTLFRTYLNKQSKNQFKKELWLIPIACYAIGVLLHSQGMLLFWRVLAYLAVFHFVRQQYGIFQIYVSKENNTKSNWDGMNKLAIYAATLIPLMIWHLGSEREMNWFMKSDFFYFSRHEFIPIFYVLGMLIFLLYIFKELYIQKKSVFLPKTLFLITTMLSWWVGIVLFQSDWAFTITNVVAHGIPYYALIYSSNLKKKEEIIWPKALPLVSIFFFLIFLGYLEEALWDVFIWREHTFLFGFFKFLPEVENFELMTLLVPLLTLPQATHYVLDGYIWRKNT